MCLRSVAVDCGARSCEGARGFHIVLSEGARIALAASGYRSGRSNCLCLGISGIFGNLGNDIRYVARSNLLCRSSAAALGLLGESDITLKRGIVVNVPCAFRVALSAVCLGRGSRRNSAISSPSCHLVLHAMFFSCTRSKCVQMVIGSGCGCMLAGGETSVCGLSAVGFRANAFGIPIHEEGARAAVGMVGSAPLPLSVVNNKCRTGCATQFGGIW